MKYIESAARMIAEVSTKSKIVVEKSTVPVKAAESISNILRANLKPGVKYQVRMRNPRKLLAHFIKTKDVTMKENFKINITLYTSSNC